MLLGMKIKLAGVTVAALMATVIMTAPPVAAAASSASVTVTGTVPLMVFNVEASDASGKGAAIWWNTNGASTSEVFYDTTPHDNVTDYACHSTMDASLFMQHSVDLGSLAPSTTYHYRVQSLAQIDGTQFNAISQDFTFTTSSVVPPSVTTIGAFPLVGCVIIWGTVGDLGSATSAQAYFQWGKTKSYGFETDGQTVTVAPDTFYAFIVPLSPGTYHFRAVVVGDATAYGQDMKFTVRGLW